MKTNSQSPASGNLNPYLAGVCVGLVLITSFVMVGRGLSMVGAFSSLVSSSILAMFPQAAHYGPFLADQAARPPGWHEWTVLVILGVFLGGLASALLRRDVQLRVSKGTHSGTATRLACVLVGGLLMGLGAKIGGGCTSGQILSGGALLGTGSWVFMGAVFAAAYAVSWIVRHWWI